MLGQQVAAALEEQKAALLTAEATAMALRCLAEIVYGSGLRLLTWQRSKAALDMLGITNAPDGVRDADR